MTTLTPKNYRHLAEIIPAQGAITYQAIANLVPYGVTDTWIALERLASAGVLEIRRPVFLPNVQAYAGPYTFRRLVDVERIQFSTDGLPIGVA